MSPETTPKDRRVPLAIVVFNAPTAIPGAAYMLTSCEMGEQRLMAGQQWVCPQPYLDPVTRTIYIEGREYPLERVHYWERARMAAKKAEPAVVNHRIGKVVVSVPRLKASPE